MSMQVLNSLTAKQREIFVYVTETFRLTGALPSVRAVAREFSYASPRAAEFHLRALVRKGYLAHHPNESPAYRPVFPTGASTVPLLGSVPAGHPKDQPEDYRGLLTLPWRFGDEAFALTVEGDSMRDAHIIDGDVVVVDRQRDVRDGDVVLAFIRGGFTVKWYFMTDKGWGLEPANPAFQVQYPEEEDDRVVGLVVALVRRDVR